MPGALVKGNCMKKLIALCAVLAVLLSVVPAFAFDFDNVFSDTVVKDDTRYQSANVSVTLTQGRQYDTDYYVADIYVKDIASFRHAFPNGKFGDGVRSLTKLAEQENAIVAVTGDYGKKFGSGIIIAEGKTLREKPNKERDLCVLYKDGTMEVLKGKGVTVKSLNAEKEVWLTMLFGPNLLDEDGMPLQKTNSKIRGKNPRTAVGYIEPGHYVMVLVDGRTTQNKGMTMLELSQLMFDLKCQAAYNLDGGQSAAMWFNGKIVNKPYQGGRQLADAFYIGEP